MEECEEASNSADVSSPANSDSNDKDGDKDAKKKKNRCATCKKKVGLTGNNSLLLFLAVLF